MAILEEWVEKAEGDYHSAVALNRLRKRPLPDAVCYHCQQCIEKYLKAVLFAHGSVPPRTHNLLDLLDLCETFDPSVAAVRTDVIDLNPYSARFRYPGMIATTAEAKEAVAMLRRVRRALRKKLGL